MFHASSLLVFLVWLSLPTESVQEVYSSAAELVKLASAEDAILDAMQTYLEKDIQRLQHIQSNLVQIRNDIVTSKVKHYDDMRHPVNALHLIQRFVTAWQTVYVDVGNFTHYNVMRTVLATVSKYFPTQEDLVGAHRSLLRLQRTYQLRTSDVASGNVMGKQGRELGEYDCFALGQRAMEAYLPPTTAIEWFEEVKKRTLNRFSPLRTQASTALAELSARVHNYHAAVKYAREALEHSEEDETLRNLVQVYERQRDDWLQGLPLPGWSPEDTTMPDFWKHYHYLCRISAKGTFKFSMEDWQKICYHKRLKSAYQPQRVEVLNSAPKILMYHNFLSNRESKRLIRHVFPKIQRARVGVTEEVEVTEDRIGKILGVERKDLKWLKAFDNRVEETFHLSTLSPGGEPLQILNYGLGGQYEPHYDFDQYRNQRQYNETGPSGYEKYGDRIATLLLYLNKPGLGGSTVFPELLLAIPPVKNSAVFWYNEVNYGEGDNRTLHAGCPVAYGQKWVANKWFREIGHEMHRKCDSVLKNTL